jgi:geranylgeranyl diphosphate synthase type II
MENISRQLGLFEAYLREHPMTRNPENLYEPADYILSLGGKRLRPVFVLLACEMYAGDSRAAMEAAMSVEVFHNFTLLHDDIMDEALLRRGKPTVHVKYNANTAILTGDVMMIQAYQHLLNYPKPELVKSLMDIFNKMAFEVCEGQQMDMDFESRSDVTIEEYIRMITYKTSVLMGASMQMGALIGGAAKEDQHHLYEFARNFGIAFQLQDDVLDTFGEARQVGKTIGGDIMQRKKTYLFLKAFELASEQQRQTLTACYYGPQGSMMPQERIQRVTDTFKDVNVVAYAEQLIEAYRDLAVSHLMSCSVSDHWKSRLSSFVNDIIFRNH